MNSNKSIPLSLFTVLLVTGFVKGLAMELTPTLQVVYLRVFREFDIQITTPTETAVCRETGPVMGK